MSAPYSDIYAQAQHAHRAGDLSRAENLYRALLDAQPRHAQALHDLGLLYAQRQQFEQAAQALTQAAEIAPDVPVVLNNLGEVLRRLHRLEAAERACRQAVTLAPDLADAHYNLANVLKMRGAGDAALRHYDEALRLRPGHVKALYNAANTLLALGRYRSAIERYRHLVACAPQHAQGWNNLGAALKSYDRLDEAAQAFRRALALMPELADAHGNLAQILEQQGDVDAARAAYRAALTRTPDAALALHADTLAPIVPDSNDQIDAYRAGLADTLARYAAAPPRIVRDGRLVGEPPHLLAYQGRDDLPLKRAWAALYAAQGRDEPPPAAQGKPHVGFVVTHGHEGVFLKCMRGLLEQWPADQSNISVVCSEPNGPAILRPALKNPAVELIALPSTLDAALHRLAAARIDALLYWEVGTDAMNYFLPFFRPARVQCTTWGWPVTSGIPHMDCYLSAAALEPADAQAHYSERLIELPALPTYYYRPPVPDPLPSRDGFGLDPALHWYFCGQNLRKLHPDFDALLGGILRADPQGLIVLIEDKQPGVTALLRRRLARTLPDVLPQIKILPRLDETRYLALTAHAAVVLDPLHYGGGANTSFDALAAGTPIVTWPGAFQRGRWALAALRKLEITEGIADSAAEYIEQAVRYATDTVARADLSRRILERASVLFEDMAAVRAYADCLCELIERAR